METKVGKVLSLFITVQNSSGPAQRDVITVDEKGILDDKHYDTDIQRSVLLTSTQSYTLAKKHGIEMSYNSLGENLLIDYNPYGLSAGTRLRIGNSVLEISQPCTLCNHLSKVDSKLPKLLKNDRGIFAKVVKEGTIKVGDTICLLD